MAANEPYNWEFEFPTPPEVSMTADEKIDAYFKREFDAIVNTVSVEDRIKYNRIIEGHEKGEEPKPSTALVMPYRFPWLMSGQGLFGDSFDKGLE